METGCSATVTSPLSPVTVTGNDAVLAAGLSPTGLCVAVLPAVELVACSLVCCVAADGVCCVALPGLPAHPATRLSVVATATSAVTSRCLNVLRCNDIRHPPSIRG